MNRKLLLGCALMVAGFGCEPPPEPPEFPPALPSATVAPSHVETRVETCELGEVAHCIDRCREGDAPSCNNLGATIELGRGVEVDTERALSFYDRACSRGAQAACINGERLRAKESEEVATAPVPAEPPPAPVAAPPVCSDEADCKKRCDAGDEAACRVLPGIHIHGNVTIEGNVKMFGNVYLYGH